MMSVIGPRVMCEGMLVGVTGYIVDVGASSRLVYLAHHCLGDYLWY